MVNDNGVLVVYRTNGNSTRATPLGVMMDFVAQLVMIGKRLAEELGLTTADLNLLYLPLSVRLGAWSGPLVTERSHRD